MAPTLVPSELARIVENTPELRNSYLVGGCVRDWVRLQTGKGNGMIKDYDVEVIGLNYEQLQHALEPWGRVDVVGKSFGVVKLTTEDGDYDFSIPRRESKVGVGHKGFAVEFDPSITPKEAAARRDFTFNALSYEISTGRLLDFFGGQHDIANDVLRHTSDAFKEDPLRVLRGMQFCGRFNLTAAPETIQVCQEMQHMFRELPVERVKEEWVKWATKSEKPSAGLRFLHQTGWIKFFPQLAALDQVPQEPEYHPEGDVLVHTMHCCDAMATLPGYQDADPMSKLVYMLSILCHDFGKPGTTAKMMKNGVERITSHGHEEAGAPIAADFLKTIGMPNEVITRVPPLVADHLAHITSKTDRALRRLAKRLHPETVEGLFLVMAADHMGRPPLPAIVPPTAEELVQRSQALGVHKESPKPLVMGRDLIPLGVKPGKEMGIILKAAEEAQLDGLFADKENGLEWVRNYLAQDGVTEAFLAL
jgi:tRNA nucleotidyltransferase (CCA-adding enzyme)